jgi:hypothetical protein
MLRCQRQFRASCPSPSQYRSIKVEKRRAAPRDGIDLVALIEWAWLGRIGKSDRLFLHIGHGYMITD